MNPLTLLALIPVACGAVAAIIAAIIHATRNHHRCHWCGHNAPRKGGLCAECREDARQEIAGTFKRQHHA